MFYHKSWSRSSQRNTPMHRVSLYFNSGTVGNLFLITHSAPLENCNRHQELVPGILQLKGFPSIFSFWNPQDSFNQMLRFPCDSGVPKFQGKVNKKLLFNQFCINVHLTWKWVEWLRYFSIVCMKSVLKKMSWKTNCFSSKLSLVNYHLKQHRYGRTLSPNSLASLFASLTHIWQFSHIFACQLKTQVVVFDPRRQLSICIVPV